MTDKKEFLPDTDSETVIVRQATRDDLRRQLRRARSALPEDTITTNSRRIAEQALPLLSNARHVAGYLAFGGEVTVDDLLAQCRRQGQTTYVPVMQDDYTLLFAPLTDTTPLVPACFGIREPSVDPTTFVTASVLDAVLVPLVGFNERCGRLGMGGGYYDRTFAHRRETASDKPLMIGVAHELQCANGIHADWWDVPLDCVVTEQRILHR